MCEVYMFAPFKAAREQAQRAGEPVAEAVAAVKSEQRQGREGREIAGRLRVVAWNRQWGLPMPPKGAA